MVSGCAGRVGDGDLRLDEYEFSGIMFFHVWRRKISHALAALKRSRMPLILGGKVIEDDRGAAPSGQGLGREPIQSSASACVSFLSLGFPAQEDRDGTVVLAVG